MQKMEVNNSTSITIYDVQQRNKEVIELKSFADEELNKIQDEIEERIGIAVIVERIVNPEQFVRKYYESQGYAVKKCDGYGIDKKVKNFFKRRYGLEESCWDKHGIPDFIVYLREPPRKEDEYGRIHGKYKIITAFFVEVKSHSDAIRVNQLDWIISNNVPVKIAYLERKDKP